MDWSNAFKEPIPLRSVMDALGSLPDQWLYVAAATRAIELATPCYCLSIDTNKLSPEEQDEMDACPEAIGLKSFLCVSQLEDIAQNLRLQVPQFSDQDLVQAIDYYWRHDAFINLVGWSPLGLA